MYLNSDRAPIMFCRAIVTAVLVIPLGFFQLQAQTRPLVPNDYLRLNSVTDPRLSPDGKYLAYEVSKLDLAHDSRVSSVWLVHVDGTGSPSRLPSEDGHHPRWSPDGTLLSFISKSQVYAWDLQSTEAIRLTDLRDGIEDFEWAPDGKKLICVSRTESSTSRSAAFEHSDARHYKNAAFKANGTGYFDKKTAHLFVIDLETTLSRQVTFGEERNDSSPSWSPDGARIAFVSERKDDGLLTNADILVVSSAGGEAIRVSRQRSMEAKFRWSPDGRSIAYTAAESPGAMFRIWVVPSAGGAAVLASKNLDLLPSTFEWSEDGRSLDAVARVRGEMQVYRIDLSTGKVNAMTSGAHWIQELNVNVPSNRAALVTSDERHPGEIYVTDLSYRNERRITHENDELLKEVTLQPAERLRYKGADDWEIDGFLIKPFGWSPEKKYPLIVSVHGGPSGMYGFRWSDDEMQVYAGKGWAVFYTNPRGSSGYGEKFQRGVEKEWGGKAYEDIMKGVETVLAKNPWIDRDRMAIRGQSYGGFMTNWIVGHTNIFKAACSVSGISDFVSLEGNRDEYYGHASDFGGDLFQSFDLYWKYSPLQYAKNVHTPTLILHGDEDQRVPLEQAEEWFRALKHFDVDSELVIFPHSTHSMRRKPSHLLELMQWQTYWFDRFLNSNEHAVAPD